MFNDVFLGVNVCWGYGVGKDIRSSSSYGVEEHFQLGDPSPKATQLKTRLREARQSSRVLEFRLSEERIREIFRNAQPNEGKDGSRSEMTTVESRLQGQEQMAAKIGTYYADLLKVGKHIMDFAHERLFLDLPEDLTDDKKFVVGACITLVAAGVKITCGVHCLAANALDELAVMSLRPLGEMFASLGWILSSPSERVGRAKLYMWAEMIEQYNWTVHSVRAGITQGIPAHILKDPAAILSPIREDLLREEIKARGSEGASERANRRIQKMSERSNWATATWEEMFRVTENFLGGPADGLNFAINYKMASGILHGRHPRMFVITSPDEETIRPNFEADDTHVGWVLFMSSLLLVAILDMTNKGLGLGMKTEVQKLYEEILSYAKQPRRPLGSPFPGK